MSGLRKVLGKFSGSFGEFLELRTNRHSTLVDEPIDPARSNFLFERADTVLDAVLGCFKVAGRSSELSSELSTRLELLI